MAQVSSTLRRLKEAERGLNLERAHVAPRFGTAGARLSLKEVGDEAVRQADLGCKELALRDRASGARVTHRHQHIHLKREE